MPKKPINKSSYNQLSEQLDEILAWFESEDFDIEAAENKYKQALLIVTKLEEKLEKTKNNIKQISSQK